MKFGVVILTTSVDLVPYDAVYDEVFRVLEMASFFIFGNLVFGRF